MFREKVAVDRLDLLPRFLFHLIADDVPGDLLDKAGVRD